MSAAAAEPAAVARSAGAAAPLHIAAAGRQPADLPLEALVNSAAVLAVKGAGKTYTGAVIAEELLDRSIPIVVLDPTGAWWGLQSSADGTGPGYRVVIFGGEHGDLPLEPTSGKVVAEAIVEHNLSAILDLSQFDSLGQQRRFAVEFAEAFHHAKAPETRHTPHVLVVDEADEFLPQSVIGEDARMVGAFVRIIKRDRIRGIWTILISQRAADVNKKALSQCHLLIALQTIAKRDRDAVEDWIEVQGVEEERAEMMAGIAHLQVGQAWVCEPRLGIFARIQIRPRRTFDSSATPKPGEVRIEPTARAEIDLGRLREAIAATAAPDGAPSTPARASAEVRRALAERDARIAQLEAQLAEARSGGGPPPPPVEIEVPVEVPVLPPDVAKGLMDRLDAAANELQQVGDRLGEALVTFERRAPTAPQRHGDTAAQKPALTGPTRRVTPGAVADAERWEGKKVIDVHASPTPKPARRLAGPASAQSGRRDLRGEMRILAAIVMFQPATPEQLMVTTGYKKSSRNSYLQRLLSRGLIARQGQAFIATDTGVAALGDDYEPLPQNPKALRDYWLGRLPAGEGRILAELIRVYPAAVDGEVLSATTGYKKSSRNAYLQRLRARQLVTTAAGSARAADSLFRKGART